MTRPVRAGLRPLGVAAVLAAAVAAAGCGGSESASPSATERWADGVCSAIVDWRGTIQDSGQSLQDGAVTRESLRAAVEDTADATEELVDDLRALDAPETEARQEADAAVSRLADELDAGRQEMKAAVDDASGASDMLNAVSVVSGTLVQLGDEVSATYAQLQQLDPRAEVSDAFSNAASCAQVRSDGA